MKTKEKFCIYVSFENINKKGEFFGVLQTPERRLPMWVGTSYPIRSWCFSEARKHVAKNKWRLITRR